MERRTETWRGYVALWVSVAVLLVVGWGLSREGRIGVPQPQRVTEEVVPPEPVDLLQRTEEVVGASVEGREVRQITYGNGEYVLLLMASIHGNEAAGTPLLARLEERIAAEPELLDGCTVVILPATNPDGMAAAQRFNARGVDLNRNFPAENRQNSRRFGMEALSEPESVAIYQVIGRWLPRHIVTLHEPLECVDYDGPADELAEAMAACCPLPVKKLGSRPGSLGSYAGLTLGVPIVTFELPRDARDQPPETLWDLYGEALIAAIRYRHPQANESAAD